MELEVRTRHVWIHDVQTKDKDLRFNWIQHWWGDGRWCGKGAANSVPVGPDGIAWSRLMSK